MPPTSSASGDAPPETALRTAIASTTPPPDVSAVDLLDDGETARVAYPEPSPDPSDPVNQHAIERLVGAYIALVKDAREPPERLEAVITVTHPDREGADTATWHVTRAWARRFLADEWDAAALIRRIGATSDAIADTDAGGG